MKAKAGKTKKSAAAEVAAERATPRKALEIKRERRDIPLANLTPSPWNPRGEITPESVSDLVASIATVGLIEPVVVMPTAGVMPEVDGAIYIIVAGHRRVAAAKVAGLATVPCDILDGIDAATAKRMTFLENLQRKDADPLLESNLVAELVADGMTTEEIAAEIGRDRKWVLRRKNLANLSASWRKRVANGENITTDCLEHVAAYPQALQERLKRTGEYESRNQGQLRWLDIRRAFASEVCDLKEAVFDCSKCYQCAKNSGCAPDLFDYDGGKNPQLGRCLDAACYKRRHTKHVADTLEAAKASRVTIVKDDPRYTCIKTSPTKTRKCCALYTWQSYDGETQILWAEAPKKKTAAATERQKAIDEKMAAERKAKRERNKAIRALAEWCGKGDAGEPCNLAKLIDEQFRDDYTKGIDPFAPFVVQEAFRLIGWPSYKLIGTGTNMDNCARAAFFGNLAVPDSWPGFVAAEIIKSLDPSRNEGIPAHHNALIILRMFDNLADATAALGAEAVAAIIPQNDDAAKFRGPAIKWFDGSTSDVDPYDCDDDDEGEEDDDEQDDEEMPESEE